jgi:outer membrane protein assembly factor BamB
LITTAGRDQLVAAASSALQGLDPRTGEVLWSLKAVGETSSPAYDGGLICSDNGRGGFGVSVRPGAAERSALFGCKSDLGSAVVLGDYVYRQSGDQLLCMELATGETVYTEKVDGASSWASPFATRDGLIYVGNAGRCHVVRAGPSFEVAHVNDLGDGSHASAAVSGGNIFFRGAANLWCIGGKPDAGGATVRRKGPRGEWVAISEGVLASLEAEGQKPVSSVTPASRVPVILGGIAYWGTDQGVLVSKDKGATWQIQGSPVKAGMAPFFGDDERHMVVVTPEGFSETIDAGRTWRVVAPLPPIKEIGWFGNYAWDSVNQVFYAARMGQPAYKYER